MVCRLISLPCKSGKPIEMPFENWTPAGSGNHVLDEVLVSDIAVFVLKRDVKLQPTNQPLDGVQIAAYEGAILRVKRGETWICLVVDILKVTQQGVTSVWCRLVQMGCTRWGAHCHHLATTVELCRSDVLQVKLLWPLVSYYAVSHWQKTQAQLRARKKKIKMSPVFSASCVQQISDLHPKFALRPHHVGKYGRHSICDGQD